MSLPPALQNKNVQILVIALGILVGRGLLLYQILGSGGGGAPPEAYSVAPYGATGGYGPPGGGYGPPGGSYGGPPGGPGVSGYGTDAASGGAPVTGAGGAQTTAKKAGPRP